MALDPSIRTLFDRMPELADYPIWEKSPEEARESSKALRQVVDAKVVPIGKTENLEAPGPAGAIALRAYTPVAAGGPSPAIVYFHGGGFVIGDLDTHDVLCRSLANDSGSRVIAVDYRRAPEFKFPAAVEDCFAALKWVEENASELSVDANSIVVGGDSAGGNLAAVMCLLAKENKNTPHVAFQLLFYPSLRLTRALVTRPFGSGYCLDDRAIQWFYSHYIPESADPMDPRLSPIEAKDVTGLPPAYVVTAGFDPLREDGVAYAEKLKAAGVTVTHVDYPTMIHGFLSMQGWIPLASEAIAAAAQAVKEALK